VSQPWIDRRQFVASSAALGLGCHTTGGGSKESPNPDDTGTPTGTPTGSTAPTSGIDLGPQLDPRVPRSLNRTDRAELDVDLVLLAGALPTDWHGAAHVVHAIPYVDGVSVFIGDGKLLRFTLTPDAVQLRSRVVKTPCHRFDQASLGASYGFETDGFARMSIKVGFRNFANTAIVALGERLLLTSDAGRPYEIDPESLEVVTAVGWNDEWQGILPSWLEGFVNWVFPLHMTTAHPAVDPHTATLFTVNYGLDLLGSRNADTHLMRWAGAGAMERWKVVDRDGRDIAITQSVHQMALTERFVILMDTAFVVEIGFGSNTPETVPQAPFTALHIIARDALVAGAPTVEAFTLVLPRESVHFAADYDDADGIGLFIAHNVGADASEMLRPDDVGPFGDPVDPALAGLPCAATDIGQAARYVVDPQSGQIRYSEIVDDPAFWGGPALVAQAEATPDRLGALFWCSAGIDEELQLRRIIDLYADHPYRTVAVTDVPARMPAVLAHVSGQDASVVDRFTFPAGRWGVSPCFAPRHDATSDTDGYVLVTVISDDTATPDSTGDELWVFDAADLAAGPVARLGHPELSMPFTLHTLWAPASAPRTAAYKVDVATDHADGLAKQTDAVKDLFASAVVPHFP
jgi:carotenoid cleavage dioxygenase-like enzyme